VPGPKSWTLCKGILPLALLLLWAGLASAYIGPGSGLELSGYFLSLVLWAGSAFLMFLLWPFYALARRLRGGKEKAKPEPTLVVPIDLPPEGAGAVRQASP